MKHIYSTLLLGLLMFTGCGGGSDGGTPASADGTPSNRNAPATGETLAEIHKYTIEAIATSGGNCKGATGEMIINGSAVSGTIKTGWGDILTIGGVYIPTSGEVSGGFARNNLRLADYSGKITNNNATGTWSDSLGCSGTWSGKGNKSNYIITPNGGGSPVPTPRVAPSNGNTFDPYNLQGYTLTYSQFYINYSLALGCGKGYTLNATRRGMAMPSEYGEKIVVVGDEIRFGSLTSFSLVGGNLVVGESRETHLGGVISAITQTKVCN